MNILRWKRKSKNKIRFKTIILFIFSLIMTTFAWFAYSKVLEPTLHLHMASWDMEYYIGTQEKTNPIAIEIGTLYPTMDEQTVLIDIYNNGETLVDIAYEVKSVTIAGTTYEIVPEGSTNTDVNYIALANPVYTTRQTTDPITNEVTTEELYKGVITNDISRFPFTIEVEHSAQVQAESEYADGNEVEGAGYLKVTVNWIGDNDVLDSEWGYRVGKYFANNPTATSAMTIVLSVESYQANPEGEEIEESLPSTTETKPYLPIGFTRVPGTNLSTGLVIKDGSGNEYVWIEVPKSTTVYTTAGLGITSFSDEEYTKIENDLNTYASAYDLGTDAYTSHNAIGISDSRYKTQKRKMLKSVYQYGGFYIGRYETGISDSDTYRTGYSATTPTETPVIKSNAYPFNYVSCSQAQLLAASMAPTGTSTSTSLLFGVQWELVLKYLNSKGVLDATLKTDSTTWGNYKNNEYNITEENSKYILASQWLDAPYEKDEGIQALLTTGANSGFCRQNIYDLAGNLSEWTLKGILNVIDEETKVYIGGMGGNYLDEGTNAAKTHEEYAFTNGFQEVGFRVSLYLE